MIWCAKCTVSVAVVKSAMIWCAKCTVSVAVVKSAMQAFEVICLQCCFGNTFPNLMGCLSGLMAAVRIALCYRAQRSCEMRGGLMSLEVAGQHHLVVTEECQLNVNTVLVQYLCIG